MEMLANSFPCPVDEIASYIDGELDAVRELELDAHFSKCAACAEELNLQKQFLCSLESSLKHENELELPPNFTKQIVANAESTVSGLRRPRERFNALFICAALMLFILFALGADAGRVLGGVAVAFDQIAAIGAFFGHFVYDLFIGVTIVLRTFASQVRPDALAGGFLGIAFVIFIALISQRLVRVRRA
jgi:anti-sigma factor RsiW